MICADFLTKFLAWGVVSNLDCLCQLAMKIPPQWQDLQSTVMQGKDKDSGTPVLSFRLADGIPAAVILQPRHSKSTYGKVQSAAKLLA